MNLAVIPARGGSKRIPRKNIRSFCGKPIIVWVIELAKQAGLFDGIIVSTDDVEIADVAANAGADVPFIRPASLSDDHAGTIPVVAHAIQWMREKGTTPVEVCCLYPTAALTRQSDLRAAKRMLAADDDAEFVIPVTRFPYPVQRALQINRNGRAELCDPDTFHTRTQDLFPAYHDAGQFYWGRAAAWVQESSIFGAKSMALELPRSRVVDIDDEEDWAVAESMFRILLLREEQSS